MPYIQKERREIIDDIGNDKTNGGDVVYFWYKKLVDLWKQNPSFQLYYEMYQISYDTGEGYYADKVHVISTTFEKAPKGFRSRAALQIALAELKRRYVDPYEDEAMKMNGDV